MPGSRLFRAIQTYRCQRTPKAGARRSMALGVVMGMATPGGGGSRRRPSHKSWLTRWRNRRRQRPRENARRATTPVAHRGPQNAELAHRAARRSRQTTRGRPREGNPATPRPRRNGAGYCSRRSHDRPQMRPIRPDEPDGSAIDPCFRPTDERDLATIRRPDRAAAWSLPEWSHTGALRLVRIRDDDADQAPVLVVEDAA
jgi:hypothetical protein